MRKKQDTGTAKLLTINDLRTRRTGGGGGSRWVERRNRDGLEPIDFFMKKRQTSTNHSSPNHSSEDQICEDVGRVTFVRNNNGEVYAKSDSDHPAVQKVIEHIMASGGMDYDPYK